jgi:hypothetical protein
MTAQADGAAGAMTMTIERRESPKLRKIEFSPVDRIPVPCENVQVTAFFSSEVRRARRCAMGHRKRFRVHQEGV